MRGLHAHFFCKRLPAVCRCWNDARPCRLDPVPEPHSLTSLLKRSLWVKPRLLVLVLLLHQRATASSLQSSSSASCCWPSWGVCFTSSTKRAKSVADPANKTCEYHKPDGLVPLVGTRLCLRCSLVRKFAIKKSLSSLNVTFTPSVYKHHVRM